MCRVAHTHRMWTATRQDLAADTRAHLQFTMRARRLTQWLTKTLQAWHTTMLGLRFWFRHSVAMKEQLAHPLLQLHSYAHSYLPTLSLHGQLYEVAHQKYLNWAAIVTHYMRAHNQWLRMACQRVEEIYLASFRKVSRDFWGEYDWAVRD